jgi:hypothetical protein
MTRCARLCVGAILLGVVGSAQASVPWSNPNGNASFFTWANGQNATGLFGSPTLVAGTTFQFFPTNFVATSNNGGTVNATDTLSVDLFAAEGFQFESIMISEGGSYSLSGPAGGSVSATGLVDIDEIGGPRTASDSIVYTPSFPVTAGSGPWTGSTMIDLLALSGGVPFTQIHLEFTNNLVAVSVAGSTATIEKTFVGLPVAITIIPSPGTVGLLAVGGLLAARRRRL